MIALSRRDKGGLLELYVRAALSIIGVWHEGPENGGALSFLDASGKLDESIATIHLNCKKSIRREMASTSANEMRIHFALQEKA